MPFTEKRLAGPTQLTTSASAIYTVPANRTTIVKQIIATNTSASAATFTLYIGAASAGNAVFSGTQVLPNDSLVINTSQVLATGEILRALASANTAINLTISGVENDGPLTPTATYIADNAITTAKLADSSVTTAKIAAGAVVTADLADNAVTQAKLSTDVPLGGMRNILINGGMDIWQRGTAVKFNQGQGAYGPDRWCGAHQYQNSRTQRTSVTSPPSGLWSPSACRVSNPSSAESAGGSRMRLVQKVESLNSIPLRGRRVTLSFWVRFSAASFTVTSGNYQDFIYTIGAYTSTTDSATNTTAADVSADGYITAGAFPTTWTKYTLSYDVPTNTNNVEVRFGLIGLGIHTSADVNWYEVTQVQLEVGSQTTPFEQRPYGAELALCQRYYEKSFPPDTAPANGIYSVSTTGTVTYLDYWVLAMAWIAFDVEKRTVPNMSFYGTSTNNWQAANSDATWTDFAAIGVFQGTVGIKTKGFGLGIHRNTLNGYNTVGYSRMCRGDWVAESEL